MSCRKDIEGFIRKQEGDEREAEDTDGAAQGGPGRRAQGVEPDEGIFTSQKPKSETRNSKPETQNLKPENPKVENRNSKPETRNLIPKIRNSKPETRTSKLDTNGPASGPEPRERKVRFCRTR